MDQSVQEVNVQVNEGTARWNENKLTKHYLGLMGAFAVDNATYSAAPGFVGLTYEYHSMLKLPRLSFRTYLGYFNGSTRESILAQFFDYEFESIIDLRQTQVGLGLQGYHSLFAFKRFNPFVGAGVLLQLYDREIENSDFDRRFYPYFGVGDGLLLGKIHYSLGFTVNTFSNQFVRVSYQRFPQFAVQRKAANKIMISYNVPLN
ncbi:MAG: hypothetical protein AAFQ83_18075 [Bacteroidota bacterium]